MPKVFTANRCYNSTFPPSHLFPGNGYTAVFLTRKIAIYILVVDFPQLKAIYLHVVEFLPFLYTVHL